MPVLIFEVLREQRVPGRPELDRPALDLGPLEARIGEPDPGVDDGDLDALSCVLPAQVPHAKLSVRVRFDGRRPM
jgi:hypothetical protein